MAAARILVVDDDPSVRNLIAAMLSGNGYEVNVAAGPTEAEEALRNGSFDLLLTDVLMPDLNGHELVQNVGKRCPWMRVLMMSGYDPEQCSSCPYLPRCNVVRKPFTCEQILAAVQSELMSPPPRIQ
jgi:two-component system cell cycle response regulator CpdR